MAMKAKSQRDSLLGAIGTAPLSPPPLEFCILMFHSKVFVDSNISSYVGIFATSPFSEP